MSLQNLIFNSLLYTNDIEVLLLQFTTNASTTEFSPSLTTTSGIVSWDFGDNTTATSNKLSHIYSLLGDKTIKMYKGTTDGSLSITQFILESDSLVGTLDISSLKNLYNFSVTTNPSLNSIINPTTSTIITNYKAYNCDLTGTLDVSGLSGLGGVFQVHNNSNLTSILNPISSQKFTVYSADECNLTGVLDISGLTGLGGGFNVYRNPNLTTILNPDSSEIITTYAAYECNLTGTLDISALTGLGGVFEVMTNPSLNYILNPDSSQLISIYQAYDCSLIGTLDVSGLTNIGGTFRAYNNLRLVKILLPTFNSSIYYFNVRDCSLDTWTIDDILSKIYTYYNANTPDTSVYVDLSGGINSPPTDGWANSSITGLYGIFSAPNDISIKINV